MLHEMLQFEMPINIYKIVLGYNVTQLKVVLLKFYSAEKITIKNSVKTNNLHTIYGKNKQKRPQNVVIWSGRRDSNILNP